MNEMRKSYCNQINVRKRIRHLPSKLLEDVYFKTIIPHFLHISVGKLFSNYLFAEIDRLHLRAAKIIQRLPKNTME